jgi:hypothetical protein
MSFYFQEVAGQARNDSLLGSPPAKLTLKPLFRRKRRSEAAASTAVRGNSHNAAVVKIFRGYFFNF